MLDLIAVDAIPCYGVYNKIPASSSASLNSWSSPGALDVLGRGRQEGIPRSITPPVLFPSSPTAQRCSLLLDGISPLSYPLTLCVPR